MSYVDAGPLPGALEPEVSAPAASPSHARPRPDSRAHVIAMLLLLALTLPWLTSYGEWREYRSNGFLLGRKSWERDEVALVWLFYAKTQLVLLPGVALALVLAARRWVNLAQAVLLAWLAVVAVWVVVENKTYTKTNVHALSYLRFLGDAYAVQWAGSLRTMSYAIGASLLALGKGSLIAGLAVIGVLRVVAWWARRWRGADDARPMRIAAATCAALYAAALVGVVPAQHLYGDRFTLLRAHALLPYDFTWSALGLQLVDTGRFVKPLNRALEAKLRETMPVLNAGAPPDAGATIPPGPRPDVVLIVMESLRADALVPDVMPRLCELGKRSIVLRQHRSGARMSHLGLYSLLYARTPAFYAPTTAHFVPPQANVTLRGAGYHMSYVASAHHENWLGMGNYLNERFFDTMDMFADGDWPAMDVRSLARTKELLANRSSGKPQFIMTFLTSTHFPYVYPPPFETRRPVIDETWHLLPFDAERDLERVLNRYRNSCQYLDHLVGEFLAGVDLTKTLVVVTGDHGESLWDDGALSHGGRWSEPQMRVPCLIVGAGVRPQVVDQPSNHMDVLPTILHVAAGGPVRLRNTTGVDLLSGTPRPRCEVLSSESHEGYYELLLEIDGRRMLFELPSNRYELLVRGTVDPAGNVDPFDLPPPDEVRLWAEGIAYHLDRLTELRAPPR